MLGHDGDLVAVHTEDFALQVDELALAHLHVVPRLEVVFPLFSCKILWRFRAIWGVWGGFCGVLGMGGSRTGALSHHLQVNALGLVLEFLQLGQGGFDPLGDLELGENSKI